MSDRKLRVLGVQRDNKACNYYRISTPIEHMQEQGLADCQFIEYQSQMDDDGNMAKVFESDVILLPRPSSEEWFGFVKACRKAGKLVVADYDDDPFTCDPMNPYYRWVGIKDWSHPDFGDVWKDGMVDKNGQEWFNIEKNMNRRDMIRSSFKRADLVTCTTDELKKVFEKINPNTVVLPNSIDLNCYPNPEFVKRKVRIGWQGGISHYRDLHMIKGVLEKLSERDDVQIVYFGDTRFGHLLKDVKNVEIHSFVPHVTYPYKLALMNLDIGLCPLEDNEFNRRKSAIKWMEYAAVGASTVASDIPPYSTVIDNFQNGILVPNDDECWIEALNHLVDDKKKNLELSRNALDTVKEKHTIQKNIPLWIEAYKNTIKQNMAVV